MRPIFFFILLATTANATAQSPARKVFDKFHSFFAKKQYDSISNLVSEDFVLVDETGTGVLGKAAYVKSFKEWDNVFDTKWNVTSVKDSGNFIVSTEYDTNIFNSFVYPDPLVFRFTYTIDKGKLTQLQYDSIPGTRYKEKILLYRGTVTYFYNWLLANNYYATSYYKENSYQNAVNTKAYLLEYIKYRSQ